MAHGTVNCPALGHAPTSPAHAPGVLRTRTAPTSAHTPQGHDPFSPTPTTAPPDLHSEEQSLTPGQCLQKQGSDC